MRQPNTTCTLDTCTLENSFFDYRPSLAANVTLAALFGLSLIINAAQGIRWRTWTFMVAMILGNLTEVLGYVGRILAYYDPFNMDTFLMQICCLTLAPAFMAAGIYLCLSRVVIIFGAHHSRLPPVYYTRLFVGCDFVSLTLQGAGGGIASVRSQDGEDPALGNNVMIGGLAFQVFTLILFILLCADFALRVHSSSSSSSSSPDTYAATAHAKLRSSASFRMFLAALALSTLCILIRSVFRLIEMSQGWDGALMKDETLFFVLEGVMIVISVLVFNVAHPGACMHGAYHAAEGEKSGKNVSGSDDDAGDIEMWVGGGATGQRSV